MNNLWFNLVFADHTFSVRTNYSSTTCYYEENDKYQTTLVLASNIHAYVYYKNLWFSGSVTKRDNWRIRLNMEQIIRKEYNKFYFHKTTVEETIDKNYCIEDDEVFSEHTLLFYNTVIGELPEEYAKVENKDEFKRQLCEWIEDEYLDSDNLDDELVYEDYLDDSDEVLTVKDELINECRNLLISFLDAECDYRNKADIVALDNLLDTIPGLKKIPYGFLNNEFGSLGDHDFEKIFRPDLFYSREDALDEIGEIIIDAYNYSLFLDDLSKRVDQIIIDKDIQFISNDELFSCIERNYRSSNIPNDAELNRFINETVEKLISADKFYNHYFSLFNSDSINVEINEEKKQLFEKYDRNELEVDSIHFAEYEVYKYVMPFYRERIYKKNSTKLKPTIAKLPDYINYADSVFNILFKHNLLIEEGETIVYNEDGNIVDAINEIGQIS